MCNTGIIVKVLMLEQRLSILMFLLLTVNIVVVLCQGSRPNEKRTGTMAFMASAGARAYNGVWGRSPQWGPGAKPLVRGSGGRSPLQLKTF